MDEAGAEAGQVHGDPSCPLDVLGVEGTEPAAAAGVGIRGTEQNEEDSRRRAHATQSFTEPNRLHLG